MKKKTPINNIKSLNVGCGPTSRWIPNTEGLDVQDFGQKYVCSIFDFEPPYLYDAVFAHHFVEHFDDTVALMEKLGSILKIGGVLDIRVPTLPHPQAFVDPTHKKFIPEQADIFFGYFTKDSMAGHCYTDCEFEIVGMERDRFEWEAHIGLKRIK
jgi:SAM-dependent methyltransferase